MSTDLEGISTIAVDNPLLAPVAAPTADVAVAPPPPAAPHPVASQPVASQPVASQPVASQPVASQPVASQPAAMRQPPEQAEVIPGEPERLGLSTFTRLGLDWPVTVWIISIHALALAAPFCFTWKGLALAVGLHWLTGGVGVCLGYHRQLTHGSFSTFRPIRLLLALLGGLSGEGSAIAWVSNHRKHHVFSDQEGDPHSPKDGGLWSHMLWFMPDFGRVYNEELANRYAPDLVKDKGMRRLHAWFLPSHIILGLSLFAIGYFGWDLYTGFSFLMWGMFVRLVGVLHVTWFVNSASHIWGYRNYETTDNSRNLWWVGLLAYGEGWHNNHHAFQRMARHGHKWWEFDMTYMAICAMEKLGLAWDVVHDVPARKKAAAA